jgi:hypothetical protein
MIRGCKHAEVGDGGSDCVLRFASTRVVLYPDDNQLARFTVFVEVVQILGAWRCFSQCRTTRKPSLAGSGGVPVRVGQMNTRNFCTDIAFNY